MKILILLLILAGCDNSGSGRAGTETGNAIVPITIALRAADVKLAAVDARGLAIEVTSAVGNVRRIDFDLPAGTTCAEVGHLVEGGLCEAGEEEERFRFEGPWTADVLAGETNPTIDGLALPAARYARVDVRMQRDEGETSLVITGTAGGGSFTMNIRDTLDARFEGEAALVGEEEVAVVLELPVATWFAGVDVGACVGGRSVVIDDDSDDACEEVYEGVTRAIERSGRLSDDD